MASAQANAERYAAAVKNIEASMAALSSKFGVPVPPPTVKADSDDARKALDADRVAGFLSRLSGITPVPVSFAGAPVPGSIGDGYVHSEAIREAAERDKPARGRKAQATDTPADDADASPLSDTDATHAIDQISRMRSRDRLQHVIDSDKRTTVQDAARKRLEALS